MCEGIQFTDLYHDNRNKFINWAKSWTDLREEDIVDIYQDACVVFWQKCQSGTLVLTVKPSTFLFGIGRNLLLERMRGGGRTVALPDGMDISERTIQDAIQSPEEDMMRSQDTDCLEKIFQQLGKTCAVILRLTFYEGKKSEEIAEIAGYASGDVVRQMRKRCMKQLRALYETHCN